MFCTFLLLFILVKYFTILFKNLLDTKNKPIMLLLRWHWAIIRWEYLRLFKIKINNRISHNFMLYAQCMSTVIRHFSTIIKLKSSSSSSSDLYVSCWTLVRDLLDTCQTFVRRKILVEPGIRSQLHCSVWIWFRLPVNQFQEFLVHFWLLFF